MNDSALYTGIDGEPDGVFGNEVVEKETKQLLLEKDHQLKELTPKLQEIISMIEGERQIAIDFIAEAVDAMKKNEDLLPELKAAARYRKYLDTLKTKFVLVLRETKGGES